MWRSHLQGHARRREGGRLRLHCGEGRLRQRLLLRQAGAGEGLLGRLLHALWQGRHLPQATTTSETRQNHSGDPQSRHKITAWDTVNDPSMTGLDLR